VKWPLADSCFRVNAFRRMQATPDNAFPATRWSLLSRIRGVDSGESRRALDELCRQYYYPLYYYIRRRGLEHHDAQDVLHEFLAKMLRNESFHDLTAAGGRLRGFLSAALQRFLANWHRDHAKERLETSVEAQQEQAEAEGRFQKEKLTDEETPEHVFERKWAHELLRNVLRRLESAYRDKNKLSLFQALRPAILAGGSLRGEDPSAIASRLGMSPGSLRVAMNRLLEDYRELLRAEVARTVETEGEVDDEIGYLMSVFQRRS
jgi:RNA polymerase sigma factor (sigma-70 family)